MTPAQETALGEVRRILTENFDSWVIASRTTDEVDRVDINTAWRGSLDSIVGLISITQMRAGRLVIETSGPTEPFKTPG